jgi:hypothetical protein
MTLHRSLTIARIMEAVERQQTGLDNPGFCKCCGHEQDGCEPDASNYECESCGEEEVFGAEELLLEWPSEPEIASAPSRDWASRPRNPAR